MTPATCIADVPGCAYCARTSRARRNPEHRCDDLCRMIARDVATEEGHAAWHRVQHCRGCGRWEYDEDGASVAVVRPCSKGRCRELHCPDCDALWMTDGPANCRC